MTDQRILRAFRTLDAPADPSVAFADRLFEDLVADLGLRRARRPAGIGARIRRSLGLERLAAAPAGLRFVWLVAALLLLLILVAATLVVGAWLQARPSPEELVRMSQAVYANPPAVRFTIRDWNGLTRVSSDGHGTWRTESWDLTPGSYFLYDGERVGYYDATTRTLSISPVTDGGPPYPLNDEFSWVAMSYPGLIATISRIPCPEPSDLGLATIAGRAAHHVGCPRIEYWIDAQTSLVLRIAVDPSSPLWNGAMANAALPEITEVTSFEVLDTVDPTDFAWVADAGGDPRTGPIAGTNLVIGEKPPAWSGTTIDGRAISIDAIGGPAALLFFSPSLGSAAYDTFIAGAAAHPRVRPLVVGIEELGTMVGFTGVRPTTLDVVADPNGAVNSAFITSWGINQLASLVLLDEEGAVSGLVPGTLTPEDLERVLAAAEQGLPIPTVERAPAASPSPGASVERITEPCGDDEMTCLKPGSILPAWSGARLQGGTLRSADLLGKALVMYTPGPAGMCDGACPDWVFADLRAFAALADRYGPDATFLLVPWGERMPGDVRAQLTEAGVDIPVVFDWDNSISRALDLVTGGVLIVDAEGRLAGQAQAGMLDAPTQATIVAALDRLLPSPSHSPAGSPGS